MRLTPSWFPTCRGPAEEERLRSGPFPPGEVSRGRGGAGPRGEVLAGHRRGAEARRHCCFGDRAAAAVAEPVPVAVTAAGASAALAEQPWGRRPLAALWRGGPDAERSSCATVSTGGCARRLSGAFSSRLYRGSGPRGNRDRPRGSRRGGEAWDVERNPRGSGLYVSPFGALPFWGPSSSGSWLWAVRGKRSGFSGEVPCLHREGLHGRGPGSPGGPNAD
ncbi:uncharacterized protein LOC134808901 [Pan troglodytes]|uniref:uncharacterized protein LOC134808901 n=1 Tax=Pan troglodytes TaxID=9598 RepID=UPI003013763B